jgi:hypothetical protein
VGLPVVWLGEERGRPNIISGLGHEDSSHGRTRSRKTGSAAGA